MTDVEGGGDFAQRGAGEMQPPNSRVVVRPRQLGLPLGVGQPLRRGGRGTEKFRVDDHGLDMSI